MKSKIFEIEVLLSDNHGHFNSRITSLQPAENSLMALLNLFSAIIQDEEILPRLELYKIQRIHQEEVRINERRKKHIGKYHLEILR